MSEFSSLISFYATTVCDFLMSPPIVYLFGAVIICFAVKIFRSLLNVSL